MREILNYTETIFFFFDVDIYCIDIFQTVQTLASSNAQLQIAVLDSLEYVMGFGMIVVIGQMRSTAVSLEYIPF